ncbi:hypothetical protein BEL04_00070 [Mucilaginibacter sp. PPCGB 2223]|nr:hypothetical protein BEL04_00070 [Mucilaginibacter sp. PPCGB 2223]
MYAVNVDDGSAHHKVNRGYTVPRKEADELRALGVNIKPDNILEGIDYEFSEEIGDDLIFIYLILDEE